MTVSGGGGAETGEEGGKKAEVDKSDDACVRLCPPPSNLMECGSNSVNTARMSV